MECFKPFESIVWKGQSAQKNSKIRIEIENAGYSNLFMPINNGFVRPFRKLSGGRYPRFAPEEGGVTHGFGFHCHCDYFAAFTPVNTDEVDSALLHLSVFIPRQGVSEFLVKYRPGGNCDDMLSPAKREWKSISLGKLAGPRHYEFKLPLESFDPNMAIKIVTASDEDVFVQEMKVIPVYETTSDAEGNWEIRCSAPFPYGYSEKKYDLQIFHDGELTDRKSFMVKRSGLVFPDSPTDAACQWLTNRLASPELHSPHGCFPLYYYDSYAKSFYAGGHVIWIRPYIVMSLVEMASRRKVPQDIIAGVSKYVLSTTFLDTFNPEQRKGYLEYCGTGNYFYGACAMLLHVTDDEQLRSRLLRFVDLYMQSQQVYTKMAAFPSVCHKYSRDDLPTMTVCGHEETMHAAVVEAYRQSGRPELLHESLGERGIGYMEHPEHGAIVVPERFKHLDNAADLYGYYKSMHMPWLRSRDAIHYRAEGLIRQFEVTGDERWIELAIRRTSNYLRYIGAVAGNEFLDINFEYPQEYCSQHQANPSENTATGCTDGEYFQDIYTAAGLLQHYPVASYLREKVRLSTMLVASTIRMDSDDPECYGEAWVPHYAWNGDYENRSSGSRVMSPAIAAGTLLRAEAVGFKFDGEMDYHAPLFGDRKILDSSSLPPEASTPEYTGFFDLPDGNHQTSELLIQNYSERNVVISSLHLNGQSVAENLIIDGKGNALVSTLDIAVPGRQNGFRIRFAENSAVAMTVHHHFSAVDCSLYAAGMDEYFGGRFVRRNVILNNPYAPVAEKSFHDPEDPESYYRQLPSDEGYETIEEASFIKTWQPFMELGNRLKVKRLVNTDDSSLLHFSSLDDNGKIILYNNLWRSDNGKILNHAELPADGLSFNSPSSIPVIRVRQDGELDPMHPEATLPAMVYRSADILHADIVNYTGTANYTVQILTAETIVLGIPKRSENTTVSFNGEQVYNGQELKMPNGFRIESMSEDEEYLRFRMRRKGYLKVHIGSLAKQPGRPLGVTVAAIDSTGISTTALRLRWPANSEPDCSHYNIYRSSNDGAPVFVGWSPEAIYTDFSALRSEQYSYYVQAVLKDGAESIFSEPVSLS